MYTFLITLWCMFISIGAIYFIGFPLTAILAGKNYTFAPTKTAWIVAPFLGIAIIILLLQNLLYLNIPIGKSFYLVWVVGIVSWLLLFKKKIFNKELLTAPIPLFYIALGIYVIHSLGLLWLGAPYYFGRGWHDQLNYTATAQFLSDYGLGQHSIKDFINLPYANKGFKIATSDRIGAMVFQAFLACSSFVNNKVIFEPAILLLPPLTALSTYLLARKFSLAKNQAYLVAAIAGCLPSLASIHLENFYSQALATPFLLLWPLLVIHILEHPHWKQVLFTAIILAAATSIYTEFYLIFAGIAGVSAIMFFVKNRRSSLGPILLLIVSMVLALCLNLDFLYDTFSLINRLKINSLGGIYPWANSIQGLERLWLGDWAGFLPLSISIATGSLTVILCLAAYYGLGIEFLKSKSGFACSVLALACLPIVIYLRGMEHYSYQFYKMLLTISPLFPLGIALAIHHLKININKYRLNFIISIVIILVALSAAGSTIAMVVQTTNAVALKQLNRGGAFKLINPDTQEVITRLNNIKHKNILICWQDDFYNGNFVNGWLSYFARQNRVWLANPLIGDSSLPAEVANLDNLPKNFLVLLPATSDNFIVGSSAQKNWGNKSYSLWNITGANWVILHSLLNADNQEQVNNPTPTLAVTKQGIHLHILSGRKGKLAFTAYSSLNKTSVMNLNVKTMQGFATIVHPKNLKQIQFTIPIIKGQNEITISLSNTNLISIPISQLKLEGFN